MGVGTAVVAALVPALEVAAAVPQLGLARSVIEARARAVARSFVLAGVLLGALAALIVAFSGHSLLAGFAALFLLLLGVAAVPALLRALALGAARLLARRSALRRLALHDVASSLSHLGIHGGRHGDGAGGDDWGAVMVGEFPRVLRGGAQSMRGCT